MDIYRNLLARLRADPADDNTTRVLADALLDLGDPRGQLMALELAEELELAERAVPACVDRVRASIQPTFLAFRGGLLSEAAVAWEHLKAVPPQFFVEEPLVRMVLESPEGSPSVDSLRGAYGLDWRQRASPENWPEVVKATATIAPRWLGLSLTPELHIPENLSTKLTSVVSLRLECSSGAMALALLRQLPQLRHLSLELAEPDAALEHVLTLEALELLDLRRTTLSDGWTQRIETWATGGRQVLGLRGEAKGHPVFDAGVLCWWQQQPVESSTTLARFDVDEISYACAQANTVSVYLSDIPSWRRRADVPITALATKGEAVVVGLSNGVVEAWTEFETVPLLQLDAAIEGIQVRGNDLAIRHSGGWYLRGDGQVTQGNERLVALALGPHGVLRADAFSVWHTGESSWRLCFPDRVHAVVLDGDEVHALVGTRRLRIRDGWVTDQAACPSRDEAPRLSALHGTTAVSHGFYAVAESGGAPRMVLYGGTYMGGDLPLTIGAIQVTHDGVVALALEHGGINLLMPGGETLKADPFEGDPRLRWLFSYNGVLLIAG